VGQFENDLDRVTVTDTRRRRGIFATNRRGSTSVSPFWTFNQSRSHASR